MSTVKCVCYRRHPFYNMHGKLKSRVILLGSLETLADKIKY